MQFKSIVILLLVSTTSSFSKDLGKVGHTFEIKEVSLLEMIKEKLSAMDKDGQIDKHQQLIQQRVQKTIERPSAVEGISHATVYRSHIYNPSFILDADIKDHLGNVIGKKGTIYNPLDSISFGDPLIFIDGDDERQVQWALAETGKVVLVKGAPLELAKRYNQSFYFDQGGVLTKKFDIREVPAKVSQQEKHLLIEVIPMAKESK